MDKKANLEIFLWDEMDFDTAIMFIYYMLME